MKVVYLTTKTIQINRTQFAASLTLMALFKQQENHRLRTEAAELGAAHRLRTEAAERGAAKSFY